MITSNQTSKPSLSNRLLKFAFGLLAFDCLGNIFCHIFYLQKLGEIQMRQQTSFSSVFIVLNTFIGLFALGSLYCFCKNCSYRTKSVVSNLSHQMYTQSLAQTNQTNSHPTDHLHCHYKLFHHAFILGLHLHIF